jgi:hypothetical protein
MIEQIAQGQKGVNAHVWLGGIADVGARQGIKHPRGDGNL